MKTHLLLPVVAACFSLAAVTSAANAALIAYEGFDYPQQTSLNSSANTGTGWTSGWSNDSWRTNYSGYGEIGTGLTYSTLSVVGQAARNQNDYNQDFRSFGTQAATGTYWISFLIQKDNTNANSFGISLFNGGSERNFMGNAGSSNFSVVGAGASDSGIAITPNTSNFFVARYNMDAGIAHFWINPSLDGAPSDANAFNGAGGTSFTAFTFDSIRLGKFNPGSGYLDEFRLGTTAFDVGFVAVPEPAYAFGMYAGFCLILITLRKARKPLVA